MITNKGLVLFAIILFFITLCVHSQNILRWEQSDGEKVLYCSEGNHVKFAYKGYLGQPEIDEGYIVMISETDVLLKQGNLFKKNYRLIAIDDIGGFRKFSVLRDLGKNITQIGIVAGSYIGLRNTFQQNNYTNLEQVGLSIAIGLAGTGVVKLLYPEKIKVQLSQGWKMQLIDNERNIIKEFKEE